MYNDLKENWSYNEWPDVDLNGNIVEKKSLKESVGISPKRRRVVVDGQEEFDGSKFVKDLNEEACPDCADKKYSKPDLSKYKNSKDIIKPDMSTKEKVCPDCGKKVCECGELKECGEVNEDLLNAKVSPKRGRVIVDGQTDFDGSKFVKDLNEAKKADKPENIKDCLMAALDEIEVPEDEELDPKKVLDAIADCLDDEAREYLCGILCPEEKEEEESAEIEVEEEPVDVEVEEEPAEDIEPSVEDEVVEEDLTPAEQKEKEAIEGPMGVVRHKDESRYNELVALEKDHSRKV